MEPYDQMDSYGLKNEVAVQTDHIDWLPADHKCPITEVEKIIEVPIEIPVGDLTGMQLFRPMPLEVHVTRTVEREEPVLKLIQRLMVALEEDVSNLQENLRTTFTELIQNEKLTTPILSTLAKDTNLWRQLHAGVEEARQAYEQEQERSVITRKPPLIENEILTPIYPTFDGNVQKRPLWSTCSNFFDQFPPENIQYPVSLETPRQQPPQIHQITTVKTVEVPLQLQKEVKIIKGIEVPVQIEIEVIKQVPVDRIVDRIIEVPLEIERVVERIIETPVQIIKQVPFEVAVIKQTEVIRDVPYEVTRIVEVPLQIIKNCIIETPLEIDRQVEIMVEKEIQKMVDRVVNRMIEVPVECEKQVQKVVEVEKETLKIVEEEVVKIVETEKEVLKIVQIEKEVVKIVQIQVQVLKIVEIQKPVPYEVEKIVEKPVDRIIQKIVEVLKVVEIEKPIVIEKPIIHHIERPVKYRLLAQEPIELDMEWHPSTPRKAHSSSFDQLANQQIPHEASIRRRSESSIEETKTVGVFSQIQHIQQTLMKHQEDLNRKYEYFQSQSKMQNEVLRVSMLSLQQQINRLTEQLTQHRNYALKLEKQNAIMQNTIESKETHKVLENRIDELLELNNELLVENEDYKLDNERLKVRLEQVIDDLERARCHSLELMEKIDSKNVEEVQHEIDDIKQWERLVDQLTSEKQSLKSLIEQAIQKTKALQQRNGLLQAEIEEYKNIVKLSEDETKILNGKLNEITKNQEEQEVVIERLRIDKATLKKSLEEVCADNQRLKVGGDVDLAMYERVLQDNENYRQCLEEYRQEVEQLTDMIENYKELLARGDEIVGSLCDQRQQLSDRANDLAYRQCMLKVKSRQTTIVEESRTLNNMIHEENKRLVKEIYDIGERNKELAGRIETLETENQMLIGRLQTAAMSQNESVHQYTPKQQSRHISVVDRDVTKAKTISDKQLYESRDYLIEQLREKLQDQRMENSRLRGQNQAMFYELEQFQKMYARDSRAAQSRVSSKHLEEPVYESSVYEDQSTKKKYGRGSRQTKLLECCQLAEELSSRLNGVNNHGEVNNLRKQLDRFLYNQPNDRSMRRQSTMDMSISGFSKLDLSLKHLQSRTDVFQNCIEQQTERSEHTRYMAKIRSEARMPNHSESQMIRSSSNGNAMTSNMFSSSELTLENFTKIFKNTPSWTYHVMLKLIQAVDTRMAETGSVASLHPRDISVYNWEQDDPTVLIIRLKEQEPFDKPIHLYLAPEVLAGQRETEQSLTWNIGVLLDLMLHGDTYFRNKAQLLDQSNHFRFRDEEQPSQVKRLIEKMIQRNPHQRLGLCQLLVNVKYQLKKIPQQF